MSPKIVLIIGNGFDLDLGLKTSYRDFIASKALEKYRSNPVIQELINRTHIERWIDIELFFRVEATTSPSFGTMEETLNAYDLTRVALREYILHLPYDQLDENSMAKYMLSTLLGKVGSKNSQLSIYNFNYTDLSCICDSLNVRQPANMQQLHGCAHDDSIIFGFDDMAELLYDEYETMLKSHSTHYASSNIENDLMQARNIIIFGHSLGETDCNYFEYFFNTCAEQRVEQHRKKTIQIITKNNASEAAIKHRIRMLTNKKTNRLYQNTTLQILKVETEQAKIQKAFDDITKSISTTPISVIVR